MEQKKSFADYWEMVKTWLEQHQHWVSWPFVKISELFQYVLQIIQSGSTEERLILVAVIVAICMTVYVAFIIGVREIVIRLPGFNRVPFGLPQNDDYQVQPTGYDRPVEFEWRYPLLWVGGTEFSFNKAMLDAKSDLHFHLVTGTEVKFIPKPHKMRRK